MALGRIRAGQREHLRSRVQPLSDDRSPLITSNPIPPAAQRARSALSSPSSHRRGMMQGIGPVQADSFLPLHRASSRSPRPSATQPHVACLDRSFNRSQTPDSAFFSNARLAKRKVLVLSLCASPKSPLYGPTGYIGAIGTLR